MAVQVVFWYSEEIVNKAYFTADSEEQGRELLKQLEDGEISLDGLPNFFSKVKSYETELDMPQFFKIEEVSA
jgi:hypothetical protein